MSKKVLILYGSPRKGGNSDLLCDEFARGAVESGHEVEKIYVRDQKIGYCRACYGCRPSGKCVIQDGMTEVLEKMQWADVFVLSSPVYFYSIDAQMKALIDRTLPQWTQFQNRELYYIMTAADTDPAAMDCTLACFRGFAACLPNPTEKGVIYGTGVYERGAVQQTEHMQTAYQMGRNV